MGWFKKFVTALVLGIGLSSNALARPSLNLQYITHNNPITQKQELALKIPVHRGSSYALIASLYTQDGESNIPAIQSFNGNRPLIYDKKIKRYVYIPARLLKTSLLNILHENSFTSVEIDNQGDEGINNLWQVSEVFLKGYTALERVTLILLLNDEINPIDKVVYNGQKILIPLSLIDQLKVDKEDEPLRPEQPRIQRPIKPVYDSKVKVRYQNPLRKSLDSLKANFKEGDKYGVGRLRTAGRGKLRASIHTGIDIRAQVGTALYPITNGVVIQVGKDRRLWRNGISVTYKTNSGLIVKYIHLRKAFVRVGQRIDVRTKLGEIGITGNASPNNPHVHVQIKDSRGKIINPMPYVFVGAG